VAGCSVCSVYRFGWVLHDFGALLFYFPAMITPNTSLILQVRLQSSTLSISCSMTQACLWQNIIKNKLRNSPSPIHVSLVTTSYQFLPALVSSWYLQISQKIFGMLEGSSNMSCSSVLGSGIPWVLYTLTQWLYYILIILASIENLFQDPKIPKL
jgi:hypothetical protein